MLQYYIIVSLLKFVTCNILSIVFPIIFTFSKIPINIYFALSFRKPYVLTFEHDRFASSPIIRVSLYSHVDRTLVINLARE